MSEDKRDSEESGLFASALLILLLLLVGVAGWTYVVVRKRAMRTLTVEAGRAAYDEPKAKEAAAQNLASPK